MAIARNAFEEALHPHLLPRREGRAAPASLPRAAAADPGKGRVDVVLVGVGRTVLVHQGCGVEALFRNALLRLLRALHPNLRTWGGLKDSVGAGPNQSD